MNEEWFCPNCKRKVSEERRLIIKVCGCGYSMKKIEGKKNES